MACPKCGCKETYEYVEDDVLGLPDDEERCAACGHIFFFEDGTYEDDDDDTADMRLSRGFAYGNWLSGRVCGCHEMAHAARVVGLNGG